MKKLKNDNRQHKRTVTAMVFMLSTSISVSGCWSSSNSADPSEDAAKELKSDKDLKSTNDPAPDLMRLSKKLYQSGMYTIARDPLASLKERYPLSGYVTFAEIKYADAFFFNREYNEAAKSYDSFIKNYPANPEIPYVKLQAARSHVASARNQGRDRQPWESGLAIYDDIISSYPNSDLANVAAQERIAVIEELSSYDREIIEFYRQQGNMPAVQDREARFKERWGSKNSR